MTDTDYADLIRRLRAMDGDSYLPEDSDEIMRQAADALASLVKERDANQRDLENALRSLSNITEVDYQRGLRDGERKGLERAASAVPHTDCERLIRNLTSEGQSYNGNG